MNHRPLIFVLLAVVLAGCGGQGGANGITNPTMLFINASADAGDITVALNDEPFLESVAYLKRTDFTSFEFRSQEQEGYDVSLQTPDGSEVFDNEARVFEPATESIAIAIGERNFEPGEEEKRLRQVFFNSDRIAPIGNKAKLTIVHAFNRGTGDQTPTIDFQNPGDNPQFKSTGIAYSATADLLVDSGLSEWVVKRNDGDAIYASVKLTLAPASIYVALISGIEGDPDPAKQPKITFIRIPAKN